MKPHNTSEVAKKRIAELEAKTREENSKKLEKNKQKETEVESRRAENLKNKGLKAKTKSPTKKVSDLNSDEPDDLLSESTFSTQPETTQDFEKIFSQLSDLTEELFPEKTDITSLYSARSNSASLDSAVLDSINSEQNQKKLIEDFGSSLSDQPALTETLGLDENQTNSAEELNQALVTILSEENKGEDLANKLSEIINNNPVLQSQFEEIKKTLPQNFNDSSQDFLVEETAIETSTPTETLINQNISQPSSEAIAPDLYENNANPINLSDQKKPDNPLNQTTNRNQVAKNKDLKNAPEEIENSVEDPLKKNDQTILETADKQASNQEMQLKAEEEKKIKAKRLADEISPKDLMVSTFALGAAITLIVMVPGVGPLAALAVLGAAGYVINSDKTKNSEIDSLKTELETLKANAEFVEGGKEEMTYSRSQLSKTLANNTKTTGKTNALSSNQTQSQTPAQTSEVNPLDSSKQSENQPKSFEENQPQPKILTEPTTEGVASSNPTSSETITDSSSLPDEPLIIEITNPKEIEENRKLKEKLSQPIELDDDEEDIVIKPDGSVSYKNDEKNKQKTAAILIHQENLADELTQQEDIENAREIARQAAINIASENSGKSQEVRSTDPTSLPDAERELQEEKLK
jgi:hypothetical protein